MSTLVATLILVTVAYYEFKWFGGPDNRPPGSFPSFLGGIMLMWLGVTLLLLLAAAALVAFYTGRPSWSFAY